MGTVHPETVAALVEGVARACRAHDMTLAGGETAEMRDLYQEGHYDLAGTIVGVVSEGTALHGERVEQGDVLVGYASSGLHTNGYTLARRIVFDEQGLEADSVVPQLGVNVADALLAVHSSYARAVTPVLDKISALAHVTGGGIPGNLARSLPEGLGAAVDPHSWPSHPLFTFLQEAGRVERDEMFSVFNMGIGMIALARRDAVSDVEQAAQAADVKTWVIGEVVTGKGVRIG
jgi:phosphoribosylformylglycinamidine cyclo-ligase